MSLYELTAKTNELKELLLNEEMADAAKDTLDLIEADFEEEVFGLVRLIRDFEMESIAIKKEIEILSNKKALRSESINKIRSSIKMNMEKQGKTNLTDGVFKLTIAKGRNIVIIDDEDALPDEYIDVKIVTKPKKKELLAAIKEGIVNGAHVEKSDTSLRIS